jgi:hypothetical protein
MCPTNPPSGMASPASSIFHLGGIHFHDADSITASEEKS